MTASMRLR